MKTGSHHAVGTKLYLRKLDRIRRRFGYNVNGVELLAQLHDGDERDRLDYEYLVWNDYAANQRRLLRSAKENSQESPVGLSDCSTV